MEISADVIGLPAHRSPPADGRGKELTILVILASVKGFLYCVHFNLLGLFFCLSTDRLFFPFRAYQRQCSFSALNTDGLPLLLRYSDLRSDGIFAVLYTLFLDLSINQKLARDLAPLRKFSYRFPPRPEGVFSGFRKKSLYLIATGIVKIKSLHKDFSAKNNIIILLVNEILMNYKMRGIHFYH